MCGEYIGERYSFNLSGSRMLGSGGNGNVYKVKVNEDRGNYYAVKFFRCEDDEEERYKRFCQEIDFLEKKGNNIEGIVPILDKYIPNDITKKQDAWYLMPLAKDYDFLEDRTLYQKLRDFLHLAETIQQIHKEGVAHRDIKPKNLLLYEGKLCLCDYGLIWGYSDERITFKKEKIGPTRILPPELDPVNPRQIVDYKYSDVYLFAKVLWMVIRKNTNGFKGPYQRDRNLIYLRANLQGASTLEPLQRLLEKATKDEIQSRITMNDCIELIKDQLDVIRYDQTKDDRLKTKITQNIYMEKTRKVVADYYPEEIIYRDDEVITGMLNETIRYSSIYVQNMGRKDTLDINEYEYLGNKKYRLLLFDKGIIVNEYRINVLYIVYNTVNGKIEFFLDDYYDENKEPRVTYLQKEHQIEIYKQDISADQYARAELQHRNNHL